MIEATDSYEIDTSADIAVIGVACRFPGAEGTEAFWKNLQEGVEAITFFSDEELAAAGVKPATRNAPNYVKASGVISNVEMFDAHFFGFSPGEAATIDPQHRLFLEYAWQALEHAGYNPETYGGLIGVYAGAGMNTYLYNNLQSNRELLEAGGGYHVMVASDKDFLATRVSYKLNLRGPSVTIQTACSTSLVAVHLACQSLRSGECDMALAGGVSVRAPHRVGYLYQEGIVLSPDGHCRAFDAQAGGTVIGNGVGIVVLKLLADAMADGDQILAVIKGSSINNDGSLKAGYTAPSLDAQAAVITEAQGVAGIEADTITYIEAHGTGTSIGDPIEVAALTKAFRAGTTRTGFCAIGSVKTNIGHLDAAAGIAGLIKTILTLQHKQIPPSLNFHEPNPRIDFKNSPFYVNTTLTNWETKGLPRRAGVSSFGIGGTNAHVVIEEAPVVEPTIETRPWQLLTLSAKTPTALDTATTNLVEHLQQNPQHSLANVAYTLQVGRKVFEHRRILVCQDRNEAITAFSNSSTSQVLSAVQEAVERPVAFMFTGQGSQYANMGLELYQTEPTFRKQIDNCCELLKSHLGFDLREVLYPNSKTEQAAEQLKQTAVTQPALFVIEYALAQLWLEWGIRPQAMIGHSIGEYTAACLAGVFSLEDALALVALRGKLMQQMPPGAMLSVALPEQELLPLLDQDLAVGVINAPNRCVVSGPTEAMEVLEDRLAGKGVNYSRLFTSHAFHSAMMDPILPSFTQQVARIKLNPPQIPCVSNVTGAWLTAAEATDPAYWARHLRQTVRFAEGVQQLMANPDQILLEVGPGQTLATLARQHPGKSAGQVVLTSARHPQEQGSDLAFILTTLGKLWLAGATVNWTGFYTHTQHQRVTLPTYPFERQRYWIEPGERGGENLAQPQLPTAAKRADVADWFYVPSWKRTAPPTYRANITPESSGWLVFTDEAGLGTLLIRRLQQEGQDVTVATAGSTFTKTDTGYYLLNPGQADDYVALFEELRSQKKTPRQIVHLWSVVANLPDKPELERLDEIQNLGFYSLLFLTQALGRQNPTEEIQIAVISNNMQEVIGGEALYPERTTILGPAAIAPLEYPHFKCRSIDVLWPRSGGLTEAELIETLWEELVTPSNEMVVAYRGQHRWAQTFEPIHLEKSTEATPRLKKDGVYLITGGLGGIGFTLAKHLAGTLQAKLVLTGRTALPHPNEWSSWPAEFGEDDPISQKIRRIQELGILGAETLTINADVTDLDQMRSAVTQSLERFGRIDGVIHAAGLAGGGLIALKTRDAAEKILASKVKGALVLDAVLDDIPLDFLLLCSSINAVVGRVGQVDYYAANTFLDAFVHARNSRKARSTFCVNWETWQEVGMAAETLKQMTTALTESPRQVKHPLLERCILANDEQSIYETYFTADKYWALYEHGVLGKPTLPGTTYLEMARAAFESSGGEGEVEIRDAYFLAPLIVEDGEKVEVRTVLQKRGDSFGFSVMSKTGDTWREHARGVIAPLSSAPVENHSMAELEERCSRQEILRPLEQPKLGDFDLQYQTIARSSTGEAKAVHSLVIIEQNGNAQTKSMEFGPRWHSLQWVKLGLNEGLAYFELADTFSQEDQPYKLHPALLDFAAGFLRLFKSQGSYLPLSYKRLRMRAALPKKIYSYARFLDTGGDRAQEAALRFNVTLIDEQGTTLVDIEEFSVIRIDNVGKLDTLARSLPEAATLSPNGFGQPVNKSEGLLQEDIEKGLTSAEGIEVFDRLMGSKLHRVIVSTRYLEPRIEQSRVQATALLSTTGYGAAVAKPKHPRPQLMTTYAAPRNEVEQKLAEIWQDVLGIEQVGAHDNFFELGGDSLLITQIHSRFRERFEQDVSVATLLQYPTIADLAQFLGEQARIEQPSFENVHERASQQKAAMKLRKQKLERKRG